MDDLISRQSAIEILGKHCNMDYGKVCGKDCECVEYMALRDWPSSEQWIPCSERMPEEEKEVLVYTDAGEILVAYWFDDWGRLAWTTGGFASGTFSVVAWMPLPEPYEDKHEN